MHIHGGLSVRFWSSQTSAAAFSLFYCLLTAVMADTTYGPQKYKVDYRNGFTNEPQKCILVGTSRRESYCHCERSRQLGLINLMISKAVISSSHSFQKKMGLPTLMSSLVGNAFSELWKKPMCFSVCFFRQNLLNLA